MENKIKEVQEYFRNKIVNGEYEILEMDQYIACILIEDKYKFGIWHAGGVNHVEIYHTGNSSNSFMYIKFNYNDKTVIFNYLKPYVDKNIKLRLIKQKEHELLKLKESLNK